MRLRPTTDSDLEKVQSIHRDAFEAEKEARLTIDLLNDASAQPCISLMAFIGERAVGHILFTRAAITGAPELSASILAPLAVIPKAQRQGIGGELIRQGLALLAKSCVDLVLVLGHPEYYPRHGFQPAGALGFAAPYPIPEKTARPGVTGFAVRCDWGIQRHGGLRAEIGNAARSFSSPKPSAPIRSASTIHWDTTKNPIAVSKNACERSGRCRRSIDRYD